MGLTLKSISLILLLNQCSCFPYGPNNTDLQLPCPDYGNIDHATVKMLDTGPYPLQAVHIECNTGYDLFGRHKLSCNDGEWEAAPRPRCEPRCSTPPDIPNGVLMWEGEKDRLGHFKKGTLVTYSCNEGYQLSPPESEYRVCEKGIWTGMVAKCLWGSLVQKSSCKPPKHIINGYYVQEKNGVTDEFIVGQRVFYSCNNGYILNGPSVQQCLNNGSWSPKIPPSCVLQINVQDTGEYRPCPRLPRLSHVLEKVVQGRMEYTATPGTEMALRCINGYMNSAALTCEPSILRCMGGVWIGDLPRCVPAQDCFPPPRIAKAEVIYSTGDLGQIARYPIGSQVTYKCLEGYGSRGITRLTCSTNGCWEPRLHPSCHSEEQFYDDYMSTSGTLLVSVATAAGVMLMLLSLCLVVMCRRRKLWSRQPLTQSVGAAVPHGSVSAGDSTSALINDPDRLALIAFADGLQAAQQSGLPSYEEAIRERAAGPGCGTGLLGYRPHRPHWPALGNRRSRGPNNQSGDALITRQSSCASHSASMRSGSAGDPMGSTDTMTPSEVSTNVTLDTVSSHSGSQPASCRAICGSLASFDTSSVVNTEGVPLLEENEMEETPTAETGSIGIADNASFKYQRTSPDLA